MPECICPRVHDGRLTDVLCPAAGRWRVQESDGWVATIVGPHSEAEVRAYYRYLDDREAVTVERIAAPAAQQEGGR